MVQKIYNILSSILLVVFSAILIWGFISKSEDTKRINDLGNTITKLREGNKQLINTVEEYKREISELYSELGDTIGNAGKELREAIETVQRLKELSEQIGN